ncbi:MAG: hypothetical protein RR276_00930 [Angelakisella sp.]
MTTTTLSSKGRFAHLLTGMLKKNFTMSVYLFVAMFIFFPLQMVLETHRELKMIAATAADMGNYFHQDLQFPGTYTLMSLIIVAGMLLAGAVIIGLLQTAGMHNKRSVDLFHSLPVTRIQLMCAWMCSGFLTLAVPFLLNYTINLGVCFYRQAAIRGAGRGHSLTVPLEFGAVAWDVFGWLITIFAIMAVVMLIATQVGSVFESFVFTGELLVAPVAVLLLNEVLFENLLVGYATDYNVRKFFSVTPATVMLGTYGDSADRTFFHWILLLWLVLGALIFLAALYLYRRRHSEIAETSGCHGVLGIVFTGIAVYLCAPPMGVLFSSSADIDTVLYQSLYLGGVAVGAVLTFLLVEAVLNRGFAGLHKRFLRGGILCGAVTLLSLILVTGGLGYEQRLPSANSTKSVTINYRGWYDYVEVLDADTMKYNKDGTLHASSTAQTVTLRNPELIEKVTDIHRRLVDINMNPSKESSYYHPYSLQYQTELGKMQRTYQRTDPQIAALLAALEETDELQQQTNPLLLLNPAEVATVTLHDNLGFSRKQYRKMAEITPLLEQLQKDAQTNGTIDFTEGNPPVCYLSVITDNPYDEPSKGHKFETDLPRDFSVPVFASYTNTLRYLGRELTAPATADEVTQLGVEDYYQYYKEGEYFVSQVDPYVFNATERAYSEYTEKPEHIRCAVERQVNFWRDGILQPTASSVAGEPQVMRDTQGDEWLYCTFLKGEEAGITVRLDIDDIPMKDFPQLAARLEQRKYLEQSKYNE